jgi:D-alanyl-lipoteichoic acid acyltransferase DltB (MBOAT superfamily)
MLFNSFSFLALFGLLAIIYYAVPHRLRWPLLLVASLGFYAASRPAYVLLLLAVAIITFGAAVAIDRSVSARSRKRTLTAALTVVFGVLFVFKYFDFFAASIDAALGQAWVAPPALPRLALVQAAGLSFYTFSCASYLFDVYRRRMEAERHFGHFALYVAFFPKLLAGPIERARPFLADLKRPVGFDASRVTAGLQLMLWGLFKKVVIADRLAGFVDAAYGQASFAPPADLVLATYFFAFQLYCDFSGYSDIAIGASKVLGFDLIENFRRPYLSRSVPEFWGARWHLSLASWFRDYLYIPLGGGRVSPFRRAFNVMIVFLVSGLWHGANWTFVVWGGLNGVYTAVASLFAGTFRRLGRIVPLPAPVRAVFAALATFHLVLLTWVFFRAASLSDATTILSRVLESLPQLPALVWARLATPAVELSVVLVLVLLLVEFLDERRSIWARLESRPVPLRWAAYYALIISLIVLGTWNLQQFVYMQF